MAGKIRYFKNMDKLFGMAGVYLPWAEEFHLEVNLKRYPQLKKFIINHERQHQKINEKYGFFSIRGLQVHRWIDLRDKIIGILRFRKELKNLSSEVLPCPSR